MLDLITIGETMVAFMPEKKEFIRYAHNFEKKTAGAESNVAIGISKLGHKSGWISKLGKDEFGEFIIRELRGEGVDTSNVVKTNAYPTGIMFKQFNTGSETSVFYYRKNSAASKLTKDDIDENYIKQAKIVHISGITPALSKECKETIDYIISIAEKNNIIVSFDPNIRLKLWTKEEAKKSLIGILEKSQVILIGIEEAEILLGEKEPYAVINKLRNMGIEKIAIKIGSKGAIVADTKDVFEIPVVKVKVVDNIGAGDAFNSGFLSGIIEQKSIKECGKMGVLMGAFAVSSFGDVEGLPDREQFDKIMNNSQEIYR